MKYRILSLVVSSILLMSFSSISMAQKCTIKYNFKGWSVFYKTYKGTGTVHCANARSTRVSLSLKGGGFTFGVSEITNGKGTMTGILNIQDIYGTYFAMDGHAGFIKSIEGRMMIKGNNFLSLHGKGEGFDLGFSFGALTIMP
ncbi:MAG: hypothetical protein KAT04_03800 [Methylococcales bacterium]|nr:hypothetical protein [Methylococcales bacterium]